MRIKILIVDEDPSYKTALLARFPEPEFSVTSVRTYGYALQLVGKTGFDIAILEYSMGSLTADYLCEEIRRRNEDTAIILTSGENSPALEKKIRGFAPMFYFSKPYQSEDMYVVVCKFIKNRFQKQLHRNPENSLPEKGSENADVNGKISSVMLGGLAAGIA